MYFHSYCRHVLGLLVPRQLGLPDVRFLEGGSNRRHHQNPEKLAGADVTLVLSLDHPGCVEELRPLAEGRSNAGKCISSRPGNYTAAGLLGPARLGVLAHLLIPSVPFQIPGLPRPSKQALTLSSLAFPLQTK